MPKVLAKGQTKKSPMLPSSGGRPGINWKLMFDLWAKSGLSKKDFLKEYGMSHTNGNIKQKTKGWTEYARDIRLATIESNESETARTNPQIGSIYNMIMEWRRSQAKDDYQTAGGIKTHIKLMLGQHAVTTPDGRNRTTLKATEIRALAQAMESIQKVQRLSLGMSTENVGIDFPESDSNVENPEEKVVSTGPLFVVEVNEGGKFKSARPKQLA